MVYPRRQHPIHHPFIETNQGTIVFVTVCSDRRRPLLARESAAAAIVGAWRSAEAWMVGRYVIMPDHIHLFCAPCSRVPLGKWVKYWKAIVTRGWLDPSEKPIWQPDFWDRQLRSNESYAQKWEYVRENPVRHGLVANSADWPYQGELNVLVL